MTNPQKTRKELQNERKANDDLLDVSSEKLLENKLELNKANQDIFKAQSSIFSNVTEEKQKEIASTLENNDNKISYIQDEINKLPIEGAKSEITETHLNRSNTNAWTECNSKIRDILGSKVDDLGQNYKELVEKRDALDETSKSLTDNHLQLLNKDIEIENLIESRGSLVEDFADTSVDMPSYTDPED